MTAPSDTISFAFNRMKISYDFLEDLIPDSVSQGTVNFFIDMKYAMGILRIPEYQEALEKDSFFSNSGRVIAEVLNLIGHYKKFFISSRRSNIEFYLMFDNCKGDDIRKSISRPYVEAQYAKYNKPTFIGFIGDKFETFKCLIPNLKVIHSKNFDLSCIPAFAEKHVPSANSVYNMFLSEDPLIQQYSALYRNFYVLRSHSEHSRIIPANGYFDYLAEKYKWAEKKINIPDCFIPLFLNLTGNLGNIDAYNKFKNKRSVDFINGIMAELKTNVYSPELIFGSDDLPGSSAFSKDEKAFLSQREILFNTLRHSLEVDEDRKNDIALALTEGNTPSRLEFNKLNVSELNNLVEEERLFLTIR